MGLSDVRHGDTLSYNVVERSWFEGECVVVCAFKFRHVYLEYFGMLKRQVLKSHLALDRDRHMNLHFCNVDIKNLYQKQIVMYACAYHCELC